ncbi:hypothetical protein [Ekhidna sp.]|uniref:hypothetical protein n=1 Tax=Ekhidna sp. TaxID=2608089 RepID=UPI003CCC3A31
MRIIISILTLLPTLIFAQNMANSIGVITLSEEYDKTDRIIEFLNEDGSTWDSFNCYGPWDNLPELQILAFKPDYFLFKIKCHKETPTHYVVVVNEETGLTKNLRKSSKVKLVNWEEYVTDVFSIGFEPSELQVFDKVGGTPTSEQPIKESIIVPKELNGDWMKIIWTSGEYEIPSDESNNQTGWIRWRMNSRITLTLYHLS